MNEAQSLVVTNESLSILDLIFHASLLVQIVMLILVAASLVSWTLIFTKASTFKNLRAEADRFENDFWSGGDLNALFKELSDEHLKSTVKKLGGKLNVVNKRTASKYSVDVCEDTSV